MAHYAKVVNGIVKQVIVAEEEFFKTFVDDSPGEWIQTSYNTVGGVHYTRDEDGCIIGPSEDQSKALRYNFAGPYWYYDRRADAFYEPQPYPSWTLNKENFLWEAPVEKPQDGNLYSWNEDNMSWNKI
jgi:hypothetical protein